MIEDHDPDQAERRLDNLIVLISDVETFKKRRAELKAEQDKLRKLVQQNDAAIAQAKEHHKAADKSLAAVEQEKENARRLVEEAKWRERKNDERLLSLDDRERQLTKRESDVKHLASKTGEQETTVQKLSDDLAKREAAHAAAVSAHEKLVAAFNAKASKVKELIA